MAAVSQQLCAFLTIVAAVEAGSTGVQSCDFSPEMPFSCAPWDTRLPTAIDPEPVGEEAGQCGLVVRGLLGAQRSDTTPWPDTPVAGGGGSVGTALSAMFEGGDLLRVDGAIVAVLPDASFDASSSLGDEHRAHHAKGLAAPGISSSSSSSSSSPCPASSYPSVQKVPRKLNSRTNPGS